MKIVTGCDAAYAPGARALLKSIRQNSPGFELWCIAYGDQALADNLEAHGYKVILNPPYPPGTALTHGGVWDADQMQPMYARLLMPSLFPDDERIVWLDADIIVVAPMDELRTMDMGGHPAAGIFVGRTIGIHWDPPVYDPRKDHGTGVLVIDIPRWNAMRVTEQCFEVMANPPHPGSVPRAVVETILNHVLGEDWHSLDWRWDQNPKRRDPPEGTIIHHWGCVMPWTEVGWQGLMQKPGQFRTQAQRLWDPYRC
jgi:lipopolysaccharide biosynthesis glycosyltransferase